ncbi:MAG TPA: cohesin domain-containing protein [Clostridia bacterium]
MKSRLKLGLLISTVLFAMSATMISSHAAAINEAPDVKVVIDNKPQELTNVPLIVSGRTLLPLRSLLTSLGVQNDDSHIIWNGKDNSVTVVKDSTKIYLQVGNLSATVNSAPIKLDASPVNYKSRVYIPVRFVAQSLGYSISWNGDTRTASIDTKTTSTSTPAPGSTPAPTATPAPGTTPAPTTEPGSTPAPGSTTAPSATPAPVSGNGIQGTIGSATASAGGKVTIPITFKNVKSGINNVDFKIGYDASKVSSIKVTAGDIVTNASVNFTSSLNNGSGVLLFTDETQGSQPITKDGVFANIEVTLISGVTGSTKITFNGLGACSDGNLKDIPFSMTDGTITIN